MYIVLLAYTGACFMGGLCGINIYSAYNKTDYAALSVFAAGMCFASMVCCFLYLQHELRKLRDD